MLIIAIPFIVLRHYGVPAVVGIAGAAAGAGSLLQPLLTKGLTRRLNAKKSLVFFSAVDVCSGLACLISTNLQEALPSALAFSGFLSGVAVVGLAPRRLSMLSELGSKVSRETASRAMSGEEAVSKVAIVLSAAIVGAAIDNISVQFTTILIAALFGLSLLSYAAVKGNNDDPSSEVRIAIAPAETLQREAVFDSGAYRGIILRSVSCLVWFSFPLGLALIGEKTGIGASLVSLGTLSYGIGTILGSAFAVARPAGDKARGRIALGWFATGAMFIGMGIGIAEPLAIYTFAFLGGLFSPIGISALNSYIVASVEGIERERTFRLLSWSTTVATTVGTALGGVLVSVVYGPKFWLIASGAAVLVVLIFVWLLPTIYRTPHNVSIRLPRKSPMKPSAMLRIDKEPEYVRSTPTRRPVRVRQWCLAFEPRCSG